LTQAAYGVFDSLLYIYTQVFADIHSKEAALRTRIDYSRNSWCLLMVATHSYI
jgi:hypothetical protein